MYEIYKKEAEAKILCSPKVKIVVWFSFAHEFDPRTLKEKSPKHKPTELQENAPIGQKRG